MNNSNGITHNNSSTQSDGTAPSILPPPEKPCGSGHSTRFVSSGTAVVVTSAGSKPEVASVEDDAVIPAPLPTNTREEGEDGSRTVIGDTHAPAVEIPPEESDNNDKAQSPVCTSRNENNVSFEHPADEEEEDESEYEYEDDDDAAFAGFLITSEHTHASLSNSTNSNKRSNENSSAAPARIEEDNVVSTSEAAAAAPAAATSEESQRKKWREPSRAAVNMSLRAQQETTGSKRRLAQDLYRIMNQDTEEAGFSLAPQSEDSMDKWTIKLFQFDQDSSLAKDMLVVGIDHIELEMKFPDQYPFEPPFVRVVKPRFKRQTGFVMNGALCMELLTKDGWNPINDIESVIVSIRSLLVVGDGRLQAAVDLPEPKYQALLKAASKHPDDPNRKRQRVEGGGKSSAKAGDVKPVSKEQVGTYTSAEAQAAYSHLSDYHKKKGWDTSGWWARKG